MGILTPVNDPTNPKNPYKVRTNRGNVSSQMFDLADEKKAKILRESTFSFKWPGILTVDDAISFLWKRHVKRLIESGDSDVQTQIVGIKSPYAVVFLWEGMRVALPTNTFDALLGVLVRNRFELMGLLGKIEEKGEPIVAAMAFDLKKQDMRSLAAGVELDDSGRPTGRLIEKRISPAEVVLVFRKFGIPLAQIDVLGRVRDQR